MLYRIIKLPALAVFKEETNVNNNTKTLLYSTTFPGGFYSMFCIPPQEFVRM